MKRELKDKWIAALRSGEYTQGHHIMCKLEPDGSKKFCCLGVLADIAGLPGEIANSYMCSVKGIKYEAGFAFENGTFEHDPSPFFNMAALNALGFNEEQQKELYCMNDGNDGNGTSYFSARSFTEIADWIEANIETENNDDSTAPRS